MAGKKKHPNEYNLTRWAVMKLERDADPSDVKWLKRHHPRFWRERSRYRNGQITTQWREPRQLANELGKRFSWFPEIFVEPMGQILMGQAVGLDDVIKAIERMGPPYDVILLNAGYTSSARRKNAHRTLDHVLDELAQFPVLGTLEALIYLLAWADHHQNHDTWNAASALYVNMIPDFIDEGELPTHEPLFDAFDNYAYFRLFGPNYRRARSIRWRREIPRYKKMRKRRAVELIKLCEQYSVPMIDGPKMQNAYKRAIERREAERKASPFVLTDGLRSISQEDQLSFSPTENRGLSEGLLNVEPKIIIRAKPQKR